MQALGQGGKAMVAEDFQPADVTKLSAEAPENRVFSAE
jgi:hypothetical protein